MMNKKNIIQQTPEYYWIDEGGYGMLGATGAQDMLKLIPDYKKYDYIFLAVGTGTTMAGIVRAATQKQKIIGVSVMKNNLSLQQHVHQLLTMDDETKDFLLLHDFHFGGYAKKTPELLQFMNAFYHDTNIPTDFVYTAKALYALKILCVQNTIPPAASILFIHTGGLQGNKTLLPGTLVYV